MEKIFINPNKALFFTINLCAPNPSLDPCISVYCLSYELQICNVNRDGISRTGPWTTTSSCCRSTRSPTWSAPPTSSTRPSSSPKMVINSPQTRGDKMSFCTDPPPLIAGVTVSELSFSDGSAPAQDIVDKWLCLVNKVTLTC